MTNQNTTRSLPYRLGLMSLCSLFLLAALHLGSTIDSLAYGAHQSDLAAPSPILLTTQPDLSHTRVLTTFTSTDFPNEYTILGDKTSVDSIASGDVNGDQMQDVVLADRDYMAIYLGNNLGELTLDWETSSSIDASALALADMGGRGTIDIITNRGGIVQVWQNDGEGNFTIAWESAASGDDIHDIAPGDMDNDGDIDLVVAIDEIGADIYRNDGNYQFTRVWSSPAVIDAESIALGDMNLDAYPDVLVAADDDSGFNTVYRNDGNMTFTAVWTLAYEVESVSWGDFDKDGYDDIVIANRIYRNLQNETFSLAWTAPNTYNGTSKVGDINKDGHLDLVLADGAYSTSETDDINYIYLNSGGFNLTEWWRDPDSNRATEIELVDLTNDGFLEVLFGNFVTSSQLHVFKNPVFLEEHPILVDPLYPNEIDDMAMGDINNDGSLDIILADFTPTQVYLNDGNGNFALSWSTPDVLRTDAIALGDVNGDGHLDFYEGNRSESNRLFINDGTGNFSLHQEFTAYTESTRHVAFVDVNQDGHLDIGESSISNGGTIRIFLNDGLGNFTHSWSIESENPRNTPETITFGDLNGDGYEDFVVGNQGTYSSFNYQGDPNQVFINNKDGSFSLHWESSDAEVTEWVDLADMDQDGDLDLAVASRHQVQVFENQGDGTFELFWRPTNDLTQDFVAIYWIDLFLDGIPELVAAGYGENGQNNIYQRNPDGTYRLLMGYGDIGRHLTYGDVDHDGDIDLVTGVDNSNGRFRLVENLQVQTSAGVPNHPPTISVQQKIGHQQLSASGRPFIDRDTIPISYTLSDAESDLVPQVLAEYSPDGGGTWFPATAISTTITRNLTTSPSGIQHTFVWDKTADNVSGFWPQTVIRLRLPQSAATPNPTGAISDVPDIIFSTGFIPSSQTYPFQIEGNRIRVYQETISPSAGVENARVYKIDSGNSGGGDLLTNHLNTATTDFNGFVATQASIQIGDQLMAMLPITTMHEVLNLYHTSTPPNNFGLDMYVVSSPGTQNLVVSPNNPLLVADLAISLEWDATQDPVYLAHLERAIELTAEILFDVSDGQVTLGDITVFHNKENWQHSHILVYASNNLGPLASLGGVVTEPMTATLSTGEQIPNGYLPGQVHMPREWSRFGNIGINPGDDWALALAHELSHYFLFLPDNYLGVDENGRIVRLDCQGSIMTSAYLDSYSEFLNASQWADDPLCQNTVANLTTGKSDWETITQFFPQLNVGGNNPGPTSLPIGINKVYFTELDKPSNTLVNPTIFIKDENGSSVSLPYTQVEVYSRKTQGTSTLNDDRLMYLGSTQRDLINAIGLEAGDELCIRDNSYSTPRRGCVTMDNTASTLTLVEVPDWSPEIEINFFTTRTAHITVTQLGITNDLHVQIYPFYPLTNTSDITAPHSQLYPVNGQTGVYTAEVNFDDWVLRGDVRVWVDQSAQEELFTVDYGGGWGPDKFGWSPDKFGWSPDKFGWSPDKFGWSPDKFGWSPDKFGWSVNRQVWDVGREGWNAPFVSSNGQVVLFDIANTFGDTPPYALQTLTTLPDFPSWLTPVGDVYRFTTPNTFTGTPSILFNYLQRHVPDTLAESDLRIYYRSLNSESWILLDTALDTSINLGSALMIGEGDYTLAATYILPELQANTWNLIGYVPRENRPVAEALGSIIEATRLVYGQTADKSGWLVHDTTLDPFWAPIVNTLHELEYGHGYWIYATDTAPLYLGVSVAESRSAATSGSHLPMTIYGHISSNMPLAPQIEGMKVEAYINDQLCGSSVVKKHQDRLTYVLHVESALNTGYEQCGAYGERIRFVIDGQELTETMMWSNDQTQELTLSQNSGENLPYTIFLPMIGRHTEAQE